MYHTPRICNVAGSSSTEYLVLPIPENNELKCRYQRLSRHRRTSSSVTLRLYLLFLTHRGLDHVLSRPAESGRMTKGFGDELEMFRVSYE
jgi:hypothetical protein